MSDSDPFSDGDDEFNFMNMFGSGDPNEMMAGFMSMLGGMGSGAGSGLDSATQIAVSIASGGTNEPNVDPIERIALEQLIRVAELHITEATGLRSSTDAPLTIAPVTRADWVRKSMQPLKPLLEKLAASMTTGPTSDDMGSDPQMAMFEQMFSAMRPMMVGMTTGSMVGHIALKSLGTYDLPLPRAGTSELLIVVSNLNALGAEWSLDGDELKMWIVLSEVAHHSVLSVPHVAEKMNSLIGRYAGAFKNDPTSLGDSLSGLDMSGGDMSSLADLQKKLQEQFGDPSGLLNSMRSPEQTAILPEIAALTAVIVGYVDHIMDAVGDGLIASYGQLTEAVRRRRVTTAESDRFVERLLGLELDQTLYDRGRAFVDGVAELGGDAGMAKLWESAETLPTPNEIGSPGLWLSRMGIDFDVEIDAAALSELEDFLSEVEGSDDEEE